MSHSAPHLISTAALVALACGWITLEFRSQRSSLQVLHERLDRIEASITPVSAQRTGGSPEAGRPGRSEDAEAIRAQLERIQSQVTLISAILSSAPGSTGHSESSAGLAPQGMESGGAPGAKPQESLQESVVLTRQREESAREWAETLSRKLRLSDGQKEQVAGVFAEYWGRMDEAWSSASRSGAEDPEKFARLEEDMTSRVKAFLSLDQASVYDQIRRHEPCYGR